MNILLCVKQVPDTADIRIDPVKNVLIRKGVPSILNPFDSYALEAAARIKDRDPATKIVALSMGPAQADAVLRECLAIAADSAYLVSGRAFGGSDTLATSYILAEAKRKDPSTRSSAESRPSTATPLRSVPRSRNTSASPRSPTDWKQKSRAMHCMFAGRRKPVTQSSK